jgi:hypothetical protein
MAYREGKTIKELTGMYGVTSLLRRHGVEPREIGLTDIDVAEACHLYPDGWSLARPAERYDVDDMTVRRYLLVAGVQMRSAHERQRWFN